MKTKPSASAGGGSGHPRKGLDEGIFVIKDITWEETDAETNLSSRQVPGRKKLTMDVQVQLHGYHFKKVTSAFRSPFDSKEIGTFRAQSLSDVEETINFAEVTGKFFPTHQVLELSPNPLHQGTSNAQSWIMTLLQH